MGGNFEPITIDVTDIITNSNSAEIIRDINKQILNTNKYNGIVFLTENGQSWGTLNFWRNIYDEGPSINFYGQINLLKCGGDVKYNAESA